MLSGLRIVSIVAVGILCLMPYAALSAEPAAVIQSYVAKEALVPLIKPSWGNFVLHTTTLNKFYSVRGYQPVWTDSSGSPNELATSLKSYLAQADRHGLIPSDYWDQDVDKLYQAAMANVKNWITFELAATEAMIRYATHLSGGRFDPMAIDEDIKFKQKEFTAYTELEAAVSYGPESLGSSLDALAPNHKRYGELMDMLAKIKRRNKESNWETLNSPGFALKINIKDPIISKLRNRLKFLGYKITDNGSELFDLEFDAALRKFQKQNAMTDDGIIGTKSEVLRALNISLNQRIAQIEVTMEKVRWLPKSMEKKHIFVNLGTTEFRLYDDANLVFYFRTVNGQGIYRTPSMRDSMTFVNLNPYWTVPISIVLRAKLPELRKNANYLYENNMTLMDGRSNKEINAYNINWKAMSDAAFRRTGYYLRQNPGINNALGVIKFPLQNPWAIYMHDTNEKNLFVEKERHISSGCVRLQQPMELAAYLLQDQPGWDINALKGYTPTEKNPRIPGDLDKKIYLKRPIPVYFQYLTAEKGEEGEMRFMEDHYGQDFRVSKAIQNTKVSGELF